VTETRSKTTFRTLVLEDDSASLALVAQAVRFELPEAEVLAARTMADARLLLKRYDLHLFILDIQLPDGCGIDFLYDIQLAQPDATVVIVTGVPLPEYRDQATAFGVLHFMEKPLNPRALGALARSQREKLQGPQGAGETAYFTASLTRLTTLDIIQLKCLGRSTQRLDFIGKKDRYGSIYFVDGEIIHAETDTKQGVEAFNEIVSWRGGKVLEANDAPVPARSIQGDWQNLLLHAVQWSDEQRLAPEERPK
jgi:DNA-binding response OmpR family regulator